MGEKDGVDVTRSDDENETLGDRVGYLLRDYPGELLIIFGLFVGILMTPRPSQVQTLAESQWTGPSWQMTQSYLLFIISCELLLFLAYLYFPQGESDDE